MKLLSPSRIIPNGSFTDAGSNQYDGTWTTDIDLKQYGVPADASAVVLNWRTDNGTDVIGFRDPDNPTAWSLTQFEIDTYHGKRTLIAPVGQSGLIDLYSTFPGSGNHECSIEGYFEKGAIVWFKPGEELSRTTTGSGTYTWDFSDEVPVDATGLIIHFPINKENISPYGEASKSIGWATTNVSGTTYTRGPQSDPHQHIIPFAPGTKTIYANTGAANTQDAVFAGYIRQPIDILYTNDGEPNIYVPIADLTDNNVWTEYPVPSPHQDVIPKKEGLLTCNMYAWVAAQGFQVMGQTTYPYTAGAEAKGSIRWSHKFTTNPRGRFWYELENNTSPFDDTDQEFVLECFLGEYEEPPLFGKAVALDTPIALTVSNSGTTDETGTWDDTIDLTQSPYNLPENISAAIISVYAEGYIGWRNVDDTSARCRTQFDYGTGNQMVLQTLVPVSSNKLSLYSETTNNKWFIVGYIEQGGVYWYPSGSEIDFSVDSAGYSGTVDADLKNTMPLATAMIVTNNYYGASPDDNTTFWGDYSHVPTTNNNEKLTVPQIGPNEGYMVHGIIPLGRNKELYLDNGASSGFWAVGEIRTAFDLKWFPEASGNTTYDYAFSHYPVEGYTWSKAPYVESNADAQFLVLQHGIGNAGLLGDATALRTGNTSTDVYAYSSGGGSRFGSLIVPLDSNGEHYYEKENETAGSSGYRSALKIVGSLSGHGRHIIGNSNVASGWSEAQIADNNIAIGFKAPAGRNWRFKDIKLFIDSTDSSQYWRVGLYKGGRGVSTWSGRYDELNNPRGAMLVWDYPRTDVLSIGAADEGFKSLIKVEEAATSARTTEDDSEEYPILVGGATYWVVIKGDFRYAYDAPNSSAESAIIYTGLTEVGGNVNEVHDTSILTDEGTISAHNIRHMIELEEEPNLTYQTRKPNNGFDRLDPFYRHKLTTALTPDTWETIDLSNIVPTWAKGVFFSFSMNGNPGATGQPSFYVRPDSNIPSPATGLEYKHSWIDQKDKGARYYDTFAKLSDSRTFDIKFADPEIINPEIVIHYYFDDSQIVLFDNSYQYTTDELGSDDTEYWRTIGVAEHPEWTGDDPVQGVLAIRTGSGAMDAAFRHPDWIKQTVGQSFAGGPELVPTTEDGEFQYTAPGYGQIKVIGYIKSGLEYTHSTEEAYKEFPSTGSGGWWYDQSNPTHEHRGRAFLCFYASVGNISYGVKSRRKKLVEWEHDSTSYSNKQRPAENWIQWVLDDGEGYLCVDAGASRPLVWLRLNENRDYYFKPTNWQEIDVGHSGITYNNTSDVACEYFAFDISANGHYYYVLNKSSPAPNTIHQFNMTGVNKWDISQLSYTSGDEFDIDLENSLNSDPYDFVLSDTGEYLYVTDVTDDTIYMYTMSTKFDITTATYTSGDLFDYSAQTTNENTGLVFSPDGLRMWIVHSGWPHNIYEYNLSTAWDVTTAAYSPGISYLNTGGDHGKNQQYMQWKSDGTEFYIQTSGDSFYKYTVPTAWSVENAVYQGFQAEFVPGQANYTNTFKMAPNGIWGFVRRGDVDTNWRFTLREPWDFTTMYYVEYDEWATVDLSAYGVPNSASAVAIAYEQGTTGTEVEIGLRNPEDPTAQSKVGPNQCPSLTTGSYIMPVSSKGTLDIYKGNATVKFYVIGWFSEDSFEWISSTDTQQSFTATTAGSNIDFEDTIPDKRICGIYFNNNIVDGDDNCVWHWRGDQYADYTMDMQGNDTVRGIVPFFGSQYKLRQQATGSDTTVKIAAWFRGPIRVKWDNSSPGQTETVTTNATWTQMTTNMEGPGLVIFGNPWNQANTMWFDSDNANPLSIVPGNFENTPSLVRMKYDEFPNDTTYKPYYYLEGGQPQDVELHALIPDKDVLNMYIDPLATGDNTGKDWDNAFTDTSVAYWYYNVAEGQAFDKPYGTLRIWLRNTNQNNRPQIKDGNVETEYLYFGAETTNPIAMRFKGDGTKVYLLGSNSPGTQFDIYEYTLGTAWDLITKSSPAPSATFDLTADGTVDDPRDIAFNSTGTKLFILNDESPRPQVYSFDLSTAWDISSAAFTSGDVTAFTNGPITAPTCGLDFSSDGKSLYIAGTGSGNLDLEQWNLTTAWDVTTAQTSFSWNYNWRGDYTDQTTVSSFRLNPSTGKIGYFLSNGNDRVYSAKLEIPWSIGTMGEQSGDGSGAGGPDKRLYVWGQEFNPLCITLGRDGKVLYVAGNDASGNFVDNIGRIHAYEFNRNDEVLMGVSHQIPPIFQNNFNSEPGNIITTEVYCIDPYYGEIRDEFKRPGNNYNYTRWYNCRMKAGDGGAFIGGYHVYNKCFIEDRTSGGAWTSPAYYSNFSDPIDEYKRVYFKDCIIQRGIGDTVSTVDRIWGSARAAGGNDTDLIWSIYYFNNTIILDTNGTGGTNYAVVNENNYMKAYNNFVYINGSINSAWQGSPSVYQDADYNASNDTSSPGNTTFDNRTTADFTNASAANQYADPSINPASNLRPLVGKNVGKDLSADKDWQFAAQLYPVVEPITGYTVPADDVKLWGVGALTNITTAENLPSHDGHILPDALLEQKNLEGDITDVNDTDLHDHDDNWLEVP